MTPNTQLPNHSRLPRSSRFMGWGLTIIAFIVGYLFWIVGRQWWWPTVIATGILLAAICTFNSYLGYKTKKYDLFIAALLTVLAPAIVITIAFGFFFSGPPS